MAIVSRNKLKSYFETGDKPTQKEFTDLIETMRVSEDLILKVTYYQLVNLRNKKSLIPGQFYAITDYVTIVDPGLNARVASAFKPFVLIVMAISNSLISEKAKAVPSTQGDFGYNMGAWQIWYSLDNDKSRFEWADTTYGKGVIYRMIDGNGNDLPYDFKNLMYISHGSRYHTLGASTTDESETFFKTIVMKPYIDTTGVQKFNNIRFFNSAYQTIQGYTFDVNCHDIHIGSDENSRLTFEKEVSNLEVSRGDNSERIVHLIIKSGNYYSDKESPNGNNYLRYEYSVSSVDSEGLDSYPILKTIGLDPNNSIITFDPLTEEEFDLLWKQIFESDNSYYGYGTSTAAMEAGVEANSSGLGDWDNETDSSS